MKISKAAGMLRAAASANVPGSLKGAQRSYKEYAAISGDLTPTSPDIPCRRYQDHHSVGTTSPEELHRLPRHRVRKIGRRRQFNRLGVPGAEGLEHLVEIKVREQTVLVVKSYKAVLFVRPDRADIGHQSIQCNVDPDDAARKCSRTVIPICDVVAKIYGGVRAIF
jgi:hypothetical protein